MKILIRLFLLAAIMFGSNAFANEICTIEHRKVFEHNPGNITIVTRKVSSH